MGVLVDKCLSRHIAKGLTRFDGFRGAFLDEAFTNIARTADVQFLGAAGEAGWAVFTQNDEMLRNRAEMAQIRESGTRVFTLTNSHLGAEGAGLVFGRWLLSIRRRAGRPGPCFWRLYEERKTHDIR